MYQNASDQPRVTLPATTRLKPGQSVTVNYYTAGGGGRGGVGACLTCEASEAYLSSNVFALKAIFPPHTSYFMRYDEMRHMHTCASCTAKFKTAGELLAWHVGHATAILRAVADPPTIYAWVSSHAICICL